MDLINQLEYLTKAKEFLSFLILSILIILIIRLTYSYFENLINRKKTELMKKELIEILYNYFDKNKNILNEDLIRKLNIIFEKQFKGDLFKQILIYIIDEEIKKITKMLKSELEEIKNNNSKQNEKFENKIYEITIKLEKILILLEHIELQVNFLSKEIPNTKIKKL